MYVTSRFRRRHGRDRTPRDAGWPTPRTELRNGQAIFIRSKALGAVRVARAAGAADGWVGDEGHRRLGHRDRCQRDEAAPLARAAAAARANAAGAPAPVAAVPAG